MTDKTINKYVIDKNKNVRDAMKFMDLSDRKTLFVIQENLIIVGSLTDGDIRRWILSNGSLNEPINNICNKKPITFPSIYDPDKIKSIMLQKRIEAVPIINDNNMLINILFWDSVFDSDYHFELKGNLDVPVVIMSGGKGTRLEPFTSILPKSLIPVAGKTLIEHIIERFQEYNIDNYYLTLNYKAEIIKAFFKEIKPSYKLEFVIEKKPLGTAGSLYLLKDKIKKPFFLINCDTIIKTDYSSFYNYHIKNNYDITIAASLKNYKIPFGTCEIDNNGEFNQISEKPSFDFLINTGFYILNPAVLDLIPKNKFFDITSLIKNAKKNGKNIGVYPLAENLWIDVGQWSEFKEASEKLNY